MSGTMSEPSAPVYLDYNATTPLAPEVIAAISESLHLWGNPSSGYKTGHIAKVAVEEARSKVANMIGSSPAEVTFTSGGTEANHLAIWTALAHYRTCLDKEVLSSCPEPRSTSPCHPSSTNTPHIVTSNIEHPAITAPLKMLESQGWCRVTWVPVIPGSGRWSVQSVLDSINLDTCLVTMMLANNETGILQPVRELFSQIKKTPPNTRCPVLLHSDVAQAIGKIEVNVNELNADMITVVGHKFYAPKIGCLYHRDEVKMTPMFYGGGQESGTRPGTENTPMIVGFGVACQLVTDNLEKYSTHMRTTRDYLRDQLIRNFKLINSDEPKRLGLGEVCWRYIDRFMLPNTLSVRIGGFTGPELLSLCQDDIEASCGAACHTGAGVSQVLVNSFLWGQEGAAETVRLSVGRDTSLQDVDRVVNAFKSAVETKKSRQS